MLRTIAGSFVLVSLALGHRAHPGVDLFTAFVGLDVLQRGVRNSCPMMRILRRAGMRDAACAGGQRA